MTQRETEVDVVHEQQPSAAYGADTLERADRVAQMDQQAADVDEVELADLGGIEVVDAHLDALDRRAPRRTRDLEAAAGTLSLADGGNDGGRAVHRPVGRSGIEEVDGDHLVGTAGL